MAIYGRELGASGRRLLRIQRLINLGEIQGRRCLSLHEYQSMEILQKKGLPVPKGILATTPKEASEMFKTLSAESAVIKAQVLAGGRGRGQFESGLNGGVHVVSSADEAKKIASCMIGSKLITKQTGAEGKICNSVFVVEKLNVRKEYYFAIALDRAKSAPIIIASTRGGVNIETVAEETPEAIHKLVVDYKTGLTRSEALTLAKDLELGELSEEAATVFEDLYSLFIASDSTMLEINPMAKIAKSTGEEGIVCMDAKISFDDNAEFRQKEIFDKRDVSQEDPLEAQASMWDLNYIKLDGSIGCMVNGAGLAMATMDLIKLNGGSPANFLDIGGAAQVQQIVEAFKILAADKNTKAILINIFGGIVRCDIVAEGVITAARSLKLDIPLVIRLQGTNVDKAKDMILKSELPMTFVGDLGDAAMTAVRLTQELNKPPKARTNA